MADENGNQGNGGDNAGPAQAGGNGGQGDGGNKGGDGPGLKSLLDSRFKQEVEDANLLLDWAVSTGKDLPDGLIPSISSGYDLISGNVNGGQRAQFKAAYRQLAEELSPVTADTLRSTDDGLGRRPLFRWLARKSRARRWSRRLWGLTGFLLVAVLIGENLDDFQEMFRPPDSGSGQGTRLEMTVFWAAKVVPFLYGALGACAYLLRSCHKYLHKRTFDPLRKPEYVSRILLGFLAGGIIILFVTPEGALIGGDVPITGVALAFLAGYSTDFLYTTLERIANAVLPKKTQPNQG